MIPFDTASNFLHKRTDHLATSVSDAELYYGDSDAALACKMYVLILIFLQLLFVGIFELRKFHRKQFGPPQIGISPCFKQGLKVAVSTHLSV